MDVALAIAGPGSRAYAFIIDWHIRLLLALTWFAGAAYVQTGVIHLHAKSPASAIAIASLPALAIYFLYQPLAELAMRGRTPGKRMAGVRIVNRQGGTPSTLALLIRNAFRLIDSLPAFYGVGLCTTIFSQQRVRLGDLAAGTLLVHDGDAETRALAQLGTASPNEGLDAATLALSNDLLLRWQELDTTVRRHLAGDLLRRADQARGVAADASLDTLDEHELQRRLRDALAGRVR